MEKKEILAYAITHAGYDAAGKAIKGGPYEGPLGIGRPVPTLAEAWRKRSRVTMGRWLRAVRKVHPHARVIRIVRARPSPCPVHADQEHGREAEELRRGIEKILADALPAWDYIEQGDRDDDVICARDLKRLVDRVDARDSVAYLERKTRPSEAERAAQVEAIMPTQQPSEASAVEVLRELVASLASREGLNLSDLASRARRVLAASGPDPMPVVRAAMAWRAVDRDVGSKDGRTWRERMDRAANALAKEADEYEKGGTP